MSEFAGYSQGSSQSKRPKKKRKIVAETSEGLLGPGWERYDATGLVPHYTQMKQVPDNLRKYFAQRERYFSLYQQGCLLDEEGWYSVTPERIALQIAERCRCDTIVDAFCGVGGNAIAFAQTCERVIAIDNSPVRLALARHNAVIYGVQDRIEFILGDFLSFASSLYARSTSAPSSEPGLRASKRGLEIDVVFLSPPWGGPSYISSPTKQAGTQLAVGDEESEEQHPEFTMDMIAPIPGDELFALARSISPNVAYFLPRNTSVDQISTLPCLAEGEKVEIEEEWMGTKLKALTCYFGQLVTGQSDLQGSSR